jgi:hypothetical protein
MFDEPQEKVTGVVPSDLRKGKHRLVVRARDSFGNIASSAAFF